MHNKPWATYGILLTALANAVLGIVGAVPPEHASILMTASIVLGAFGKAIYNLGDTTQPEAGIDELETID